MKTFLLISALLSSFSSSDRLCEKVIYDEDCKPSFLLRTVNRAFELFDLQTNTVVETYSVHNNPYALADLEYGVYVRSPEYGHQYVGVIGGQLVDLQTMQSIEPSRTYQSIYDSLDYITYADIPSFATFCNYSYYFQKFPDDGFGDNSTEGSCCLVSMEILFDYYDALVEESVIDYIYDNNLSGPYSKCAQFPVSPAAKGDQFHEYMKYLFNHQFAISFEDRHGAGISWMEQNSLINHYIGNVQSLSYTNNTSEGNWSDIFSGRQFGVVSGAIDAGRPVILNNLNHSMVAFAYDDTYVYVMTGWRGTSIRMARMTWDSYNGNIFTNVNSAYDLIITEPHICGNSYHSTTLNRNLCPTKGD